MISFRCSEKKKQGTIKFSGDLTIHELADMIAVYDEALASSTAMDRIFVMSAMKLSPIFDCANSLICPENDRILNKLLY